MEIKSIEYLVFCFIICAAYFALYKSKLQKYVLLAADVFCVVAMSDFRSLAVIVCITAAVFVVGKSIEKAETKNKKKVLMYIGMFFSIGVLVYFKFFRHTFAAVQVLFSGVGIELTDLIVPVGLSYYTLSLSGYILDIYHGKYKTEESFIDFLCFIMFFPAIIEGPINLYKKIIPQIKENHSFDFDRMVGGLIRMLWGYFKKVVIADRIGIIVMGILSDKETNGSLILLALILYSFQIYGDFSGGIDVIMGVSEILGFNLTENFNAPLISKSVTEYWQRWHKSLGEWMEKYIYYPIVLNKNLLKFSKKIKNKHMSKAFSATLASVIVFVVVGVWHGTGWNYVVYGLYQALFVASAVALMPVYRSIKNKLHINEKCISWQIFCVLRTFTFLLFGRLLIKASNLEQAGELIGRLCKFDNWGALFDGSIFEFGLDYKNFYVMIIGILILIVTDILQYNKISIRELILKQDIVFRYSVYMIGIFAIIIFGIYGPGFDASSFIYQGF